MLAKRQGLPATGTPALVPAQRHAVARGPSVSGRLLATNQVRSGAGAPGSRPGVDRRAVRAPKGQRGEAGTGMANFRAVGPTASQPHSWTEEVSTRRKTWSDHRPKSQPPPCLASLLLRSWVAVWSLGPHAARGTGTWGLDHKDTHVSRTVHSRDQITHQRPHLQIPAHWASGFQRPHFVGGRGQPVTPTPGHWWWLSERRVEKTQTATVKGSTLAKIVVLGIGVLTANESPTCHC